MSSEGFKLPLDTTRKSLIEIKKRKLVKEKSVENEGANDFHNQFDELPDEVTCFVNVVLRCVF